MKTTLKRFLKLIKDENWKHRCAALIAVGDIAEDCYPFITPKLITFARYVINTIYQLSITNFLK